MTAAASASPADRAAGASDARAAPASMPPGAGPRSGPLFRLWGTGGTTMTGTASGAATGTAATTTSTGPRLGLLAVPGRAPVATPAFFPVASRGAVPHVTPDHAAADGFVAGAYFALEDFVETVPLHPQRRPPIFGMPLAKTTTTAAATTSAAAPSRLHAFTAFPPHAVSVLAARRHPAAAAHLGNGPDHISIVTSTGFQKLTLDAYHAAVDTLQPDLAVALADLTFDRAGAGGDGAPYPAAKRAVRMAERTEDWIERLLGWGAADGDDGSDSDGDARPVRRPALFAPTLPVPYATQWTYLNRLAEWAEAPPSANPPLAGLAVYDVDLLPDLDADYAASLAPLPRLSLHPAPTPHHVLRQVALGADVLLLPAITEASEQGLAYAFAWPGEEEADDDDEAGQQPLAIDLADPAYQTDLGPLRPGCACAACAAHHRAYVHHLLDAHEMLAWTLLQLHNHHAMAALLAGVRASLAAAGGADAFRAAARRFARRYAPELPVGRAVRPRARGYQAKTAGVVDAPLNKPAWGRRM